MSTDPTTAATAPAARRGVLRHVLVRETWHHSLSAMKQDTDVLNISVGPESGGGVFWEFTITQGDAGGAELRVKLFDDAWGAFTEIPEFFAGLAALGRDASVEEVVDLLTSLGSVDATVRERPQPPAAPLSAPHPATLADKLGPQAPARCAVCQQPVRTVGTDHGPAWVHA